MNLKKYLAIQNELVELIEQDYGSIRLKREVKLIDYKGSVCDAEVVTLLGVYSGNNWHEFRLTVSGRILTNLVADESDLLNAELYSDSCSICFTSGKGFVEFVDIRITAKRLYESFTDMFNTKHSDIYDGKKGDIRLNAGDARLLNINLL
jgi:hypothetical protein